MFSSTLAGLRGTSTFHKIFAMLLAGCVASFVLGQVAGHQPRRITGVANTPARTAAIIGGSLSTPIVVPPHVVVPLSAQHPGQGHGGEDRHGGHGVPPAKPLPKSGHKGGHHKGGAPMPPVPASPSEDD